MLRHYQHLFFYQYTNYIHLNDVLLIYFYLHNIGKYNYLVLKHYVKKDNTENIIYYDGGVEDSKIGLFHEIYDIEMISMIILK